MAEQKQEQEEEDEYDGPWIEKRIEWKCPDRKRHNVVLFGSWNRFKGGDELEYQGKQVFAASVKLPLGNYVYRFLLDGEDWETDNVAPKTARNGTEYNTVHVTEDSDDEELDEFAAAEKEKAENDADADAGGNTTLMMGADGKLTMGKKRRGRPSVELDLGQDFAADAGDDDDGDDDGAPDEEAEADGNEADNDASSAASGADSAAKKKPKKKRKRNKKKRGKKGGKEQDKEWAKYVFVQQLRLQQQHNDEINRVKTLWKQERQVRVEMHKKVLKQLKENKAKLAEQDIEIERLQKTAKIGASAESKQIETYKDQIQKIQAEKESLQQDLTKKDKDFTEFRKQRVEDDKQNRQIKGDWDAKERKYQQELNGLKSQVRTLEQTQTTLNSNLSTLKEGSEKTMELKAQQYAEREKQWKQEKEEAEATNKELKKFKGKVKSLEQQLIESKEQTSVTEKKVTIEKENVEAANKKIKGLHDDIIALKNSTEAADKLQVEVNKVRAEKEAENKVLVEKLNNTEKSMEDQKKFYEDKLSEIDNSNKAEIAALKSNSDKEMTEVMDKLKADIGQKNDALTKNQEEISKLQSSCAEEKANNDALTGKVAGLEDELKTSKTCEEDLKKEIDGLKDTNTQKVDEISALQSSARQSSEESASKIAALENELRALKESNVEENKSNEERVASLEKQIFELKNTVNAKNEASTTLTLQLTDAQQEIEKYKNNETAMGSEISGLKEQLSNAQETITTKEKEFQESISKLESESEAQIQEKDAKIVSLNDNLNAKTAELTAKLEEFSDAETKIQQLVVDLDASKKNLENEKKNAAANVASYQQQEERIRNLCKSLFAKFTLIRQEMKSVQEEQISQLEEVSTFFGDFSPLLAKVFAFNQGVIDDLLEKYKRELSQRRKYFNLVQDLRGNIRVFCRFRPLLPFELKKNFTECVKFPHGGAVKIVDDQGKKLEFEFDQVYNPKTNQAQVSEDATEYIQSVMDGYNVSIFAYGQTGSGKTYTMEGPKENPGVNLRALKYLFKISEERSPQFQYIIKLSIFEIYNERINDLIVGAEEVLRPEKKKKSKKEAKAAAVAAKKKKNERFKIRHLPDGSVVVEGLTKVAVSSDEDILKLNKIAKKNRSASATDMNAHSSRSHMLLVVYVSGINIPANIKYFGTLYLVDLAGSERVKKSGAVGKALLEARNINKSLSALGDVMQALQNKSKFIPYRNSTLTDLMSNALGGNAKTIMFINCCPASAHAFETVSSLKFAKRVGKVELGQAKKNTSKSKK